MYTNTEAHLSSYGTLSRASFTLRYKSARVKKIANIIEQFENPRLEMENNFDFLTFSKYSKK